MDVLDVFQWTRTDNELEGEDVDKSRYIGFGVYYLGIVTYEQNKLELSAFKRKYYVFTDGIHTRPLEC